MQGSARQLFQRLQEPMEEDTLKSHFEKIIKIGQKHHYRRSQVRDNYYGFNLCRSYCGYSILIDISIGVSV